MKFKAGDMVTMNSLVEGYLDEGIDLFPDLDNGSDPTSSLMQGEYAIVISLSSHDGVRVYVLGPRGAGWTFGAFLKVIK